MFWLQFFKYFSIGLISFNAWKIAVLIAFDFVSFQSVFWGLLLIALILQIGITSPQTQESLALKFRSTREKVATANTVVFLACIFAVSTTILEVLNGTF
ncbi:MAG: hypothetical protein AAFO04_27495 [Cyanobacteria bacterium J06592_8]